MNISPRSICWWNSAGAAVALLGAIGLALAMAGGDQKAASKGKPRDLPSFLDEFKSAGKAKPLPLFLDDFLADREVRLIQKEVRFPSPVGAVKGFWVRPLQLSKLPAVLMIHDQDQWTDWMKLNARHLASIGYEVLLVNLHRRRLAALRGAGGAFTDEASLAELQAAVRWLRGRNEVLPNRLGVLAWGWSGGQALALASATAVQACVVCDASIPTDPALLSGLRETPILGVFGEKDIRTKKALSAFRKHVACKTHIPAKVQAGFLGPAESKTYSHDAAEDAWVEIYNFLEKHVEDAGRVNVAPEPGGTSVATIADLMRAVNEPAGVRGVLSRLLEQKPNTVKQWQRIRAHASLIAESGVWLERQPPPKGSADHWKSHARAYSAAAEAIVNAADRRDYAVARRALVMLAGQCASCHETHR